MKQLSFHKKLRRSRKLVQDFIINNYKPIVLFSGGRDSLVVLHIVKTVAESIGIDDVTAIYADTTVSTPGNLDYVKDVCKELEVTLVVVKPEQDFFKLVEKWGFPTRTRRWCCYALKIKPIKDYLKTIEDNKVIFDGIRRNESHKRRNYPEIGYHRHFKCPCCHVIFYWSSNDVRRYIEKYKLKENPLYRIFPRATECWCTAYKTANQFKALKEHFPELFAKFVEAEAKLKTGGSALFKGGKKIYLRDL